MRPKAINMLELLCLYPTESKYKLTPKVAVAAVLPAKRDNDFMFCLQSYQGLIIDRSLLY